MRELEVVATETAGELHGPGLSEIRSSHRLPVGNGPGCEDSEHDHDPGKMRGMPEFPQFTCAVENGDDDGIEEKQMHRPFREHTKPEENRTAQSR